VWRSLVYPTQPDCDVRLFLRLLLLWDGLLCRPPHGPVGSCCMPAVNVSLPIDLYTKAYERSDGKLAAWMRQLVDREVREGDRLENLEQRSQRIEARLAALE
jgi:hypothetical protein